MLTHRHLSFLVLLLAVAGLSGCPGFPGAPPGGGQAQQQGPPTLSAPPGLTSGGARSLMASAITAPENADLLVRYSLAGPKASTPTAQTYAGAWHSCRRLVISEGAIMLEGLDFKREATTKGSEVNLLLPVAAIGELAWRYEPGKPPTTAPKTPATAPQGQPPTKPLERQKAEPAPR